MCLEEGNFYPKPVDYSFGGFFFFFFAFEGIVLEDNWRSTEKSTLLEKGQNQRRRGREAHAHNYNHLMIISVWGCHTNWKTPQHGQSSATNNDKNTKKKKQKLHKIRCTNDCCCEDCLLKTTHRDPSNLSTMIGPPSSSLLLLSSLF